MGRQSFKLLVKIPARFTCQSFILPGMSNDVGKWEGERGRPVEEWKYGSMYL